MTPGFQITVGGVDYTALIADRLLELRLVDVAGWKSDYLELVLDDRSPIPPPAHGAQLVVRIGYLEEGLQDKGAYTHDETEFSGPPREMVIRAPAINFRESFNAPRTRSFDDITLGDLVDGIAKEHGYTATVDPSFRVRVIPHLDQTAESDLRFLTRLGLQHDALFKAAGKKLVLIPKTDKGDSLKQQLGSVKLRPEDVSNWRVTRHDKTRFDAVEAQWYDLKAAKTQTVRTGEGKSVYTLQETFPNKEDAENEAKAKLADLTRASAAVSLSLPGDPKLVAEGELILADFREGVDGTYLINRVEHSISKGGGYQCRIEAEMKGEDRGASA